MAKKKPQELPGGLKPSWRTPVAIAFATELLKRLIDLAVELLKHWW